MDHKEQPKPTLSPREAISTHDPVKQPFVEPKLTWVEPKLVQRGTLTAEAQGGGFFGSFSP